jgi:hypothetical protein
MENQSTAQSTLQHKDKRSRNGGARSGAGRPRRDVDKWMIARGIHPATAAEILSNVGERQLWYRVLNSEDDGVCLRALAYLTDKRDGRASQQINITSVGINMTTSEIESARAIVREIMGDRAPIAPVTCVPSECIEGDLSGTDGTHCHNDDANPPQAVENARLMLPSNEGQESVVPTPNTSGV